MTKQKTVIDQLLAMLEFRADADSLDRFKQRLEDFDRRLTGRCATDAGRQGRRLGKQSKRRRYTMKKHIQVAMLGLIVLVVGVIAACGGGGNTITSEDYGSAWPFTVNEVELHCEGDSDIAAAWVEHDGKRYPLTGFTETYWKSRTALFLT